MGVGVNEDEHIAPRRARPRVELPRAPPPNLEHAQTREAFGEDASPRRGAVAAAAVHEEQLVRHVLRAPLPARILSHILSAKFGRSAAPAVRDAAADLTPEVVEALLRNVVQQKF